MLACMSETIALIIDVARPDAEAAAWVRPVVMPHGGGQGLLAAASTTRRGTRVGPRVASAGRNRRSSDFRRARLDSRCAPSSRGALRSHWCMRTRNGLHGPIARPPAPAEFGEHTPTAKSGQGRGIAAPWCSNGGSEAGWVISGRSVGQRPRSRRDGSRTSHQRSRRAVRNGAPRTATEPCPMLRPARVPHQHRGVALRPLPRLWRNWKRTGLRSRRLQVRILPSASQSTSRHRRPHRPT